MKQYFRILSYLKEFWKPLTLATVSNILFVIFSTLSVGSVMPFIDILFSSPSPNRQSEIAFNLFKLREYISYQLNQLVLSYDRLDLLLGLCIAIVITFMLKNLFFYLQGYFMATVDQGITRRLRDKLYAHLHQLSMSFFNNERKGNLISTIVNDVRVVQESLSVGVNGAFRDPPQIIMFVLVLFFFDWSLTLFICVLLPVTGFLITRLGDMLKRESKAAQERMADVISVLSETLSNVRVVKAFRMEEFEINKFKNHTQKYFQTMRGIQRRKNLASPLTEFLGAITIAIILWFIGKNVVQGTTPMTPGALLLFVGIIVQMLPSLKSFGLVFNSVQEGSAAANRVLTVLDIKPNIYDKKDAATLSGFKNKIEFKNVSFQYETGDIVLKRINCEINAGETVAIVGPSGAGKSTLVDLIPRFYDVSDGSVTIDGMDVRSITMDSLRSLMGIVTQETILFNDTVRNNIAYGHQEVEFDKIVAAAKVANAHDFISSLPEGYDTVIGDRGVKISGGERQRISLARAILKNPPILILDEATSALDTENEILVQQAIERLMEGRTSIVIAHRLSTVQRADKIIVLEDGKIVEIGKHSELLAQSDSLYKKLHELQFQI
ncbi:MAG: ABC transporter ATP-binding protein [Ignavibacteriales bacterium]|nr:ABC transporter ATP-binding protein [Ignavibacteriales bacterium]